jgi:D-alanyl-D-alanine carboxypeptidase (penicillin-binding protein 5/6)
MIKQRRKKSKIKYCFKFLIVVFISAYICNYFLSPYGLDYLKYLNIDNISSISLSKKPDRKKDKKPDSISIANLNSPYAILICLDDQTIIMQKKSEERIYPASLTKIMTAILAINNLPDLQKKIRLSGSMFQKLYHENASLAGFCPDENVRAIDLLYGVMLPSGAECCIGLADSIAGSEQNFVIMMNELARKLGLNHTNFKNSTGLHDKNHYTTIKDLAVLLSYSLENDTFRKIFTSSCHTTKPTDKHPDGITFYSTMFKNLEESNILSGKILGGKTGYTDEAGLCLASLAKEGRKEYILITAGARGNHNSEQYNITDAITVYNSLGKDK